MTLQNPESDVQLIQKKILHILDEVHNICETHEIPYFIIGGTLIGAVRHGGFIPWDDDIDIGMLRRDYEKFLKIAHLLPKPLSLQHPGNDDTYIFPFAKCYDTSTTLIEKTISSFVRGVWIDIFPLDNCFEVEWAQKAHYLSVRAIKTLISHKTKNYRTDGETKTKIIIRSALTKITRIIPKRVLLSTLDMVLKLKRSTRNGHVGNLLGRWGIKEISRFEVFSDRVKLPFSGKMFYAPKGYDEYLKKIYNNYMSPPPLDKQKPEHINTFFDIDLPYVEYKNQRNDCQVKLKNSKNQKTT